MGVGAGAGVGVGLGAAVIRGLVVTGGGKARSGSSVQPDFLELAGAGASDGVLSALASLRSDSSSSVSAPLSASSLLLFFLAGVPADAADVLGGAAASFFLAGALVTAGAGDAAAGAAAVDFFFEGVAESAGAGELTVLARAD